MAQQDLSQDIFKRVKPVCVPLLGASLLTSTSIPDVSRYLNELHKILLDLRSSGISLTSSLISYIFYPLSTLLRRNAASDIPDRILEKVFIIVGLLYTDWWWDCDIGVWEQVFLLCGSVVGGMDQKGKKKARDDETKEAAGGCLLALLRVPVSQDASISSNLRLDSAEARLETFKAVSRTEKFLPIIGQTLDSLLVTVDSPHLPLQRVSISILSLLVGTYAADSFIPSVLPGVVSRMSRVALGTSSKKGWANGEIVSGALEVMQFAIVRAVGNDICIKEGAIHPIIDLEDFTQAATDHSDQPSHQTPPFSTLRTSSWLRGTSSQLLIALNTLTTLVTHPTPSALSALSNLSTVLLSSTSRTMPEAQPLLLHWLLSLSNSDFPTVSTQSQKSLLSILTSPSEVRLPVQQTLLHITNDNLLALPGLISTHADVKVAHAAGNVQAVCKLVSATGDSKAIELFISTGIGRLLGPTGGIEKWGSSLLSVLELREPSVTVSTNSSAQLMLESNTTLAQGEGFPEIDFKNVFSSTTRNTLENMFYALGQASGDNCLFSVEWFANVGRSGSGSRSTTATWCASRLLEGVANASLRQGGNVTNLVPRSKRLTRLARSLTRGIAEFWDERDEPDQTSSADSIHAEQEHSDSQTLVHHVKGVAALHENLRITRAAPSKMKEDAEIKQHGLHRALLLQLLAVSAGILQAQFSSLLLHALYPVLRSVVSSDVFLSSSALATLNYIATVTSFASPANLLLSNFDYALDAISRRLSRRWLDVEATKVLALMVRLVGSDIVERAGDVVEECFDRLDDFHGYGIIVEGLVEVLSDVVNVIKDNTENDLLNPSDFSGETEDVRMTSMDDLLDWLPRRHEIDVDEVDNTDYGPAPKEAWGKDKTSASDADDDDAATPEPDPTEDPPLTPTQALTKQIVARSSYFLTHSSPVIRVRILSLLASSVPILTDSALLPSIHSAWPFILNRLSDPEPFVVSSAAILIESLATHFGSFMYGKIWDDIWPKFRSLLNNLDAANSASALSRRGFAAVGTQSAYTHSHRTYRSIIKTMTAAAAKVHLQETSTWQVLLAFRRFLHREAHEELQQCARELYSTLGKKVPDAVWLALSSTMADTYVTLQFLASPQWDISSNTKIIFDNL
ncbi:hypothetical protein H0H93_004955 [Arthromyces matolae]|nr:hypothetical protein H0H93_004955 [Arthromyces matolae]